MDLLQIALGTCLCLLIILGILLFRGKAKRGRLEAALALGQTVENRLANEQRALVDHISKLEDRFRPVVDLDAEVVSIQSEISKLKWETVQLQNSYASKKAVYDRLLKEVAIFDDRIAFAEMGVYEPHFDFDDSETFKRQIEQTHQSQKDLISRKAAILCAIEWEVGGSRSAGVTMTNRAIKLTLRAFNNECDAAIANTRWNNVNAMQKRIEKAFEQINKLNETIKVSITQAFLDLKLRELFLTHEYREKLKREREERAELVRAQKEEAKFLRDMERAEEEQEKFARLLAKAKAEAQVAVGPQIEAFNAKVQILERDLAEAQAKFARAQAMAERTRCGYVYIISNVGSFGEDVVKIGLTRRLDPADRVRELGDASVPFLFDTHAIIYSDDAPSLERALHNEFEPVRINAQNYRKEFFRAKIEDVEKAVRRLAPAAAFFKDVEAQDYRETLAKRKALLTMNGADQSAQLPVAI